MRKRLYEIIEVGSDGDKVSLFYDKAMLVAILVSMLPLFSHQTNPVFWWIDHATAIIFIIDYALRLFTADFRYPKLRILAFLRYPFSLLAIIDLLAILPVFTPASAGLRLLKMFRLSKALKALKVLRYSRSFNLILTVIEREKKSLLAVCYLAGGYIIISALVMFWAEPEEFQTYFDAFYWAVVTLTTVGYGDIYPLTNMGRIVSMISSFVGIAIVALPTGIISAGYSNALRDALEQENNKNHQ